MMLQSGRVTFTIFPWREYLCKVHDSEEFSCTPTAFALGLVHPACAQMLHRVGFLISAYFISTFVF